ncbi:hypothetical protein [Amycolatopsis sp. DSM 110486]|uniref:hypothetical protein n=1 Tax=Amycolatopsis sp. DSM 110486 TaxID=2865832 RepID=UPI001C69B5B1|nr:hypothetical protein [Amycolatopsis sp. DSM 110486]QYN22314.1 hypothetical protein K1T34_07460 [Amycolatopsis sp. DSM 110486]
MANTTTPGSTATRRNLAHVARHILERHADFRRLFPGNSVSLLGSSVTTVAVPLAVVLTLHTSSVYMGLLKAASAAQTSRIRDL